MNDSEYDEERKLWVPGRRSFLFMLGSAAVGLCLPPEAMPTEYFTTIDCKGRSILQVYEESKYIQRQMDESFQKLIANIDELVFQLTYDNRGVYHDATYSLGVDAQKESNE